MRIRLGLAVFTLALTLGTPAVGAGVAALGDTRSGIADEVGYLTLVCEPAANVSIDGQAKGPTPVTKLPLPVGAHQITLVSLDGKLTRTLGVTIAKDETKRLRVNLGP
jgi:hypothetical protein